MVADAKPFRDYVGFQYWSNEYPQLPIYFWQDADQILNIPNSYDADNVTSTGTWGFYTCKGLKLYSNATALAGLSVTQPGDNSNATIVLGANGNVLANGVLLSIFENDTDDSTYADNFELWENEISFMLRPTINNPSDMTIEVGSRGQSIAWTPFSFKPHTCTLLRNSFELYNGPWDGSPVLLDLEEDNLGSETFYLTVYDIYGQSITDAVVVTKEDTTAPAFVDAPDNVQYEEGTTTFMVSWIFTDMFPGSYVFYIDGEYETSDVWDGSEIPVNAGDLSPGLHNLTIAVNDTSGNVATSAVFLTVTESSTTSTTTPTTTSTTESTTTDTTTEPTDGDYTVIIIIIIVGSLVVVIIIIMLRKKS